MNVIRKCYCRGFQRVMKLAVPRLPYRRPPILNSLQQVPQALRERDVQRVLIVTDPSICALGLIEPLKAALQKEQIFFEVFDGAVGDPTIEMAETARRVYVEHHCQGLIAFGGGSAMDCAKAVGARMARPRKSLRQLKGIMRVLRCLPLMVAIPTTSGTGSETTVAAVITDQDTGHKFTIMDPVVIPHVVVHDPAITVSLPPFITATTGMDTLTHAIEAYIGSATTKASEAEALEAVRLISENLLPACQDGSKIEARANMLHAAYLAGRAFSRSYVGYCHAIAHSLGGKYHIPHGLANAVLLPYVLDAYGSAIYPRAKKLAIAMHLATEETSEAAATHKLISWIRWANRTMGLPDKLEGVQAEDVPQLSAYADQEANPLYPVPVLMDRRELERFYYDVMEDAVYAQRRYCSDRGGAEGVLSVGRNPAC